MINVENILFMLIEHKIWFKQIIELYEYKFLS